MTLFTALLFCTLLFSCSPEPTTHNRKVTRVITNSNKGNFNAPGGEIYCTVSGENCWEWVGSGDEVIFRTSQTYSNFIAAYDNNNLDSFFQTNEWRLIFPEWTAIREPEINNIINGNYAVRVMDDSSIVIFNNNTKLEAENVLFAIKK